MMKIYEVWFRKHINVNTDPQRRCYNGCNFSEENVWTEWQYLADYASERDAKEAVATFQSINPGREYRVD